MTSEHETTERWIDVVGWEAHYEVSDLGRVRSKPRTGTTTFGERTYGGKLLRSFASSRGYLSVNLKRIGSRKQVAVHTIVLCAFVGPRQSGMQACHGNGDRLDARLRNLRWDTVSNNHKDKWLHGTEGAGVKNPNAKLTDEVVQLIRGSDESIDSMAESLGVSRGCIEKVKYRQTWGHI